MRTVSASGSDARTAGSATPTRARRTSSRHAFSPCTRHSTRWTLSPRVARHERRDETMAMKMTIARATKIVAQCASQDCETDERREAADRRPGQQVEGWRQAAREAGD